MWRSRVQQLLRHRCNKQERTCPFYCSLQHVFNPLSSLTNSKAKLFLDQGSQCSFITKKFADRLDSNIVVKGVGEGYGNRYTSYRYTIGITFLTAPNTQKELPLPLYTDEPDILLGSNFVSKINPRVLKHLPSGFALYESELRPMIGGSGSVPSQYLAPLNVQVLTVLVGTTQFSISDLWNLDLVGINLAEECQENDAQAQQMLNRSFNRLSDGCYCVGWPWKSAEPNLASNFGLYQYANIIQQQLEAGIIERAPSTPSGPQVHCIPHQMVWNEEKKKLHIVYDASASAQKGRSLNDNLFRGSVMLPDMTRILLQLRQPPIALIGDLEKAFLQVQLNEIDRT
ncbi:unnamed protein product [Toxocara canis]|uniref:DUF1758 domain-containing protein n=1 Tax=Toxocara canis TaxID=6265 RepID=A0A183U4N2_TOXCA|nr:unnamed protein product [Toxocara canis]